MTNEEAQKFFDDVLRAMWDNWKPSNLDTALWLAILRQCKYEESEMSLRRWYSNTDRITRKPIPGQIRNILIFENREENPSKEARKEFGLQRLEGGKITWFYINSGRKRDEREIGSDAERARLHAEELYGGEWVIIQPPKDKPDDGLRGQAALAQAEKNILAGPDTPGRRFLYSLGRKIRMADIKAVFPSLPLKPDDGIPI